MERKRHSFSPSATLTEAATREYPGAEIAVSFPDHWELVHRFKRANTPLYVAGFPPSQEQVRGDHFFGLPSEINQSLTTYRLYKLFELKPVYQFEASWDTRIGKGALLAAVGCALTCNLWGRLRYGRVTHMAFFGSAFRSTISENEKTGKRSYLPSGRRLRRIWACERFSSNPMNQYLRKGIPSF